MDCPLKIDGMTVLIYLYSSYFGRAGPGLLRPTRKHASYQMKNAWWHFRVWVLRQNPPPLPPFYQNAERLAEVGNFALE